jgi:signal transduction histidine kinase
VRSTQVRSTMQEVEIVLEPGPVEPVVCNVDRQRLLPVLLNLIENAIDVSPPGEQVLVRLRHEEPAPDRPGDDGWACLEVEDHGPGIPTEVREHIYKRFFTTKERGLGLGLAMARHSVEEHGGKLEYDTRTLAECEEHGVEGARSGTTFRVKLPIKRQNAEEEA